MLTEDSVTINVAEPSGEQFSRIVGSVGLFANFFANCSAALDICCLFSPISRIYHPAKRALLLPGTPRMLGRLPIAEIAEYYQLAIYTIHPELLELPQAVFWPGYLNYIPEVDLIPDLQFGINLPAAISERAVPGNTAVHKIAAAALAGLTKDADAMFQVVIEEECFAGFFSADLLSALLRGQIPVYFGDPLIGRWFDPAGIIMLAPDRIEDLMAKITTDFFAAALDARRVNLERAKNWIDPMILMSENLAQKISQVPPMVINQSGGVGI